MDSIDRLVLITSNWVAPYRERQLATEGTCAPMKTPVGLLRRE